MNIIGQRQGSERVRFGILAAAVLIGATAIAACSGSSAAPAGGQQATVATTTAGSTASAVLPVTDNPIVNPSTVEALKIDSVLVENNVDASGKMASDHLEIALSNTGSTELSGFEVFYTFTDPTDNITESYYTKLPDSFMIPPGGQRIAHFDNTGAPDHFPVNDFSLYSSSANALDVTVMVSAQGAAPVTANVQKDAGGQETAD